MNDLQFPSYFIKVKGLNIHYKCLGKGSAIIFLHGGASDWREWLKNLAFFAQYFRVYALDLPGFGLSEKPDTLVTPFWFGSFLRNFMETLNVSNANLIGHSLGGTIALAFTLSFPEKAKKVVIVDSSGLGKISRKGQLILFLIRIVKRIFGKEKGSIFIAGGTMDDWLLINRLHELRPPIMIVWGGWDPYLPVSQAKLAQSLIPSCELQVFRGCRHAPQRERSDKFNSVVYQFLTR